MNKKDLKNIILIKMAREKFYYYCKLKFPNFYTNDKTYLREICDNLQEFYYSKDTDILILNCPPRHGKSLTMQLFTEWVLGKNTKERIITASYNEALSSTFSKKVRNTILEKKATPEVIVYNEIFDSKIKRGDGAAKLWSLEGEHASYLATSPTGTVTGFGSTIMIIDDLIKNASEAFTERILDEHYSWFTNTMLSRNENGKIIIVFTRWSKKDLVGKLLDYYNKKGKKIKHLVYKAEQDDGTMLCPEILNKEQIAEYKELFSPEIFNANYNQEPIDIKGALYNKFLFYKKEELSKIKFDKIINYTDTADTGDDYLCSITAGIYKERIYILDVIYTKAHMEDTEIMVADALKKLNVNNCRIEANSGGRGFARNVVRISNNELKNNTTVIKTFTQTKPKNSRIYSNKDNIMNNVYYPEDWEIKYSEFFRSMVEFQAEGKNNHDDAQDCLTGIYETFELFGYYKIL